jgi:hypothetical protein
VRCPQSAAVVAYRVGAAPAACCAVARVRHLEHFYDHERIERMLFDGVPEVVDGMLRPELSRPGFGFELKRADLPSLKLRYGLEVTPT